MERLAYSYGIHVAHVCAWNTSKLAYDGSDVVLRGKKVSEATPFKFKITNLHSGPETH